MFILGLWLKEKLPIDLCTNLELYYIEYTFMFMAKATTPLQYSVRLD